MNITTTIVEWRGKTVYRKCKCRETAHDAVYVADNSDGTKLFYYACRNCNELHAFRK